MIFRLLLVTWVLASAPLLCMAQLDIVTLDVEADDVGIGGHIQPGCWTPLHLTLTNQATTARRVMCEWAMPDNDGDVVHFRRIVTLSPVSTQQVWLYAMTPLNLPPRSEWSVRIIEVGPDATIQTDAGRVLAKKQIAIKEYVQPDRRAIGILGTSMLGLQPYEETWTRHEACRFIRAMEPSRLPDRWYGLSLLSAIIWTPAGGDPASAEMTEPSRQAIRQWVSRGGHLIVIMRSVGDPWLDSPLADMLPVTKQQLRRQEGVTNQQLPRWLGRPTVDRPVQVMMNWFELPGDSEPGSAASLTSRSSKVAVLLRDEQRHPIVVAGQYGLGRVTLVGVDLTDPQLAQAGLPNSFTQLSNPIDGGTLWAAIFGWRGPVFTQDYIDAEKGKSIAHQYARGNVDLSKFVSQMIALKETASPALMLAILVFAGYWLLAGPIGFVVLKRKKLAHHAWLGFLIVVVIFSLVSWAGAWVLRPSIARIVHFSVLRADAASNIGWVKSRFALFVPRHGLVDMAIGSDASLGRGDTLVCPGLETESEAAGFIDPQDYPCEAANPNQLKIPIRSTAKEFEADCQFTYNNDGSITWGPTRNSADNLSTKSWMLPHGKVTRQGQTLKANLTHSLLGGLRDVLVVYCPGDGQEPHVWRHGNWPAGQPLTIDRNIYRLEGQRLALPPAPALQFDQDAENRRWRGHLGDLFKNNQSVLTQFAGQISANDSQRIQMIELLSFFGTLPPPDFRDMNLPGPVTVSRSIAHELDLTPLLPLHRLIIIGHFENQKQPDAVMPFPLTVDQVQLPASGWTVIQWISPVETNP